MTGMDGIPFSPDFRLRGENTLRIPKTWQANGKVVVISDSGGTLKDAPASWKRIKGKHRVGHDGHCDTASMDTLYGVGFESEPDLSRWVILRALESGRRRVESKNLKNRHRHKRDSTAIRYAVEAIPKEYWTLRRIRLIHDDSTEDTAHQDRRIKGIRDVRGSIKMNRHPVAFDMIRRVSCIRSSQAGPALPPSESR